MEIKWQIKSDDLFWWAFGIGENDQRFITDMHETLSQLIVAMDQREWSEMM